MAELWRDIEEDIDDELDARKATVDLDAGADTVDASVDLGPIRSMLRTPDLIGAIATLAGGLVIVHWLAPKLGALVMFLIVLGLFVVWAGMIAGVDFVGGLLASTLEVTVMTSGGAVKLLKRSRPALAIALLVLIWGIVWHVSLSPTVRNRARVDRVLDVVLARLGSGEDLQDDLVTWLEVNGSDPDGLGRYPVEDELCDLWGEPLIYRVGPDGRFQLYSTGANQFDDLGRRDDYGHVEPLTGADVDGGD